MNQFVENESVNQFELWIRMCYLWLKVQAVDDDKTNIMLTTAAYSDWKHSHDINDKHAAHVVITRQNAIKWMTCSVDGSFPVSKAWVKSVWLVSTQSMMMCRMPTPSCRRLSRFSSSISWVTSTSPPSAAAYIIPSSSVFHDCETPAFCRWQLFVNNALRWLTAQSKCVWILSERRLAKNH